MEAYRASKKLEYEIRTKWDGLQVDLTSGYPSTVTARPAPPRIVDRNFEVAVSFAGIFLSTKNLIRVLFWLLWIWELFSFDSVDGSR